MSIIRVFNPGTGWKCGQFHTPAAFPSGGEPRYAFDKRLSGGWELFSPTPRPERLWGLPSLLSHGYQGLFP